jgi:hypothetical protein|tara:strand:+ start:439 stop:558 length:120 start_codon:yes stop_codon:yes gene_type:complete
MDGLSKMYYGVPGLLLFFWGKSEWSRNKKLKADGTVKNV